MWVARNENGELYLWNNKPTRHNADRNDYPEDYPENYPIVGSWVDGFDIAEEGACGAIPNGLFPELKWEDEPIEVDLVPAMLNATQRKTAEAVGEYFEYVGHVQDIHPYDKKKEQDLYNNMCWRWQDWEAVTSDMPNTWDLNFDDYVDSKKS